MLKFQSSDYLQWPYSPWFVSVLVGNPEDKVSLDAAYFHYSMAFFPLCSIKINPNTNESKEEGLNNNNQGGGTKNMYNNFPILEITLRIVLSCKLVT